MEKFHSWQYNIVILITLILMLLMLPTAVYATEITESLETEPVMNEPTKPSHAHIWGKWIMMKTPSTLVEGQRKHMCETCGEVEVQVLAELGDTFNDVIDLEYYALPVDWAVKESITTGTSKTTFSPNENCTRAQIVTFLWRAYGEAEPTISDNPFKDITSSSYYYKAVLWAVENGITSGVSADSFAPNANCTRAQVVTFLGRAESMSLPEKANNPFEDVKVDSYYYDAVLWAVENGITSGTSRNNFSPDAVCSRGQIVTFLYRTFDNKLGYVSPILAEFPEDPATCSHSWSWAPPSIAVYPTVDTEGKEFCVCMACGYSFLRGVPKLNARFANIPEGIMVIERDNGEEVYYTSETGMRLGDVREWGEVPEIKVLEDRSWEVTFYNQNNEQVTFHIPLPKYPGHERNAATIRNTGEVYCDWK